MWILKSVPQSFNNLITVFENRVIKTIKKLKKTQLGSQDCSPLLTTPPPPQIPISVTAPNLHLKTTIQCNVVKITSQKVKRCSHRVEICVVYYNDCN